MLLVGFGWAKPVPVDMRYFKKPKQGMAITALAGPVSNLLLAMLLLLGARITIAHYVDTAFCSGLFEFPCDDGVHERRSGAFQPHPHLAARRVEGALRLSARPRVHDADAV